MGWILYLGRENSRANLSLRSTTFDWIKKPLCCNFDSKKINIIVLQDKIRRRTTAPVKASIVATLLCCRPLLAATLMVYSVPGSRSVRVVVVTSLGTMSCRRKSRQVVQLVKLALSLHVHLCMRGAHLSYATDVFKSGLHLGSDAGWRCERDHVVVDGALDDTPHQSDSLISGGRHSQIHGHVQTCCKRGKKEHKETW